MEESKMVLRTEDLVKKYGKRTVVSHVSINVKQGEIVGLLGPNGAGKTTVFNLLTGVYKPTEGIIRLDGQDITGKSTIEINKAGIARTFQNIRLWKTQTVFDNVLIAKHMRRTSNLFTAAFHLNAKEEAQQRAEVLELLKGGFLTTGHAKVVLGLPTPELQEQAAQIIADNQLNVRQAEALCKKLAKPAKEPREPKPRGTLPVEVEESLKQVLGSEVNVAYHDGKGRLTVHFYSDEQLRAFANLLGQYQNEE